MKIFDCFMYFDEEVVLDLRLNTLDKYVDYFVIVESIFTHRGDKRKLHFNISLTIGRVMVESNVAFIVADAPPPHAERECWLETNLYNWHMEGREWLIFQVTFVFIVKTKQNRP